MVLKFDFFLKYILLFITILLFKITDFSQYRTELNFLKSNILNSEGLKTFHNDAYLSNKNLFIFQKRNFQDIDSSKSLIIPNSFKHKNSISSDTNFKKINIQINGIVISNNKRVPKTRIKISKNGNFYKDVFTDSEGRFKAILNRNKIYKIEAFKNGYKCENKTILPGQMIYNTKGINLSFQLKEKNTTKKNLKQLSKKTINSSFFEKPNESEYIETSGIVLNNNKPVVNAIVRIFENNKLIISTNSNTEGKFKVVLSSNKKYTFRIVNENYKSEIKNYEPNSVKNHKQIQIPFKLKKFKEKGVSNNSFNSLYFIGTVTANGKPFPNVDAELYLEGDKFLNIKTNELGQFSTKIFSNNLYTLLLKKKDYYSNQISFYPYQKTNNDTVILNFEMPIRNTVIKSGSITENHKPIPNAEILVYEEETLIKSTLTNNDGTFKIPLRANQDYRFIIKKINYFFEELKVSTLGEKGESNHKINLNIRKLQKNKSKKIKNIYFEHNKWSINFYAKKELNKLAEFLKTNPKIKEIEIKVHTDNRGSKTYNKKLSQKRANACVTYLIEMEIPVNKLKAKGYGETKPIIESPLNEEEHALNRRVEFEITKISK